MSFHDLLRKFDASFWEYDFNQKYTFHGADGLDFEWYMKERDDKSWDDFYISCLQYPDQDVVEPTPGASGRGWECFEYKLKEWVNGLKENADRINSAKNRV